LLPIQEKAAGLSGPAAFGVGIILIAFAPLIRGGNRYVPLIVLEWLGLLALWLVAAAWLLRRNVTIQHRFAIHLSFGEWVLILSPLWATLIFLTPLPISLWMALPGRGLYLHALNAGWRPLSLTPDATVISLLAGIPVVAAFLLSRATQPALFRLLPATLVLMALVQAVWGLLQAGPFKELYFGAEFAGGLIGSFANANHFANFIAMTLPLTVFMIWRALPATCIVQRQRSPIKAVLWSLVLLVLMAAILTSGSRTGAVTALLVTLLSVFLLLGSMSKSFQRCYVLGAVAFLLGVLVIAGANSLVTRFEAGRLSEDASIRWQLAGSSWQAALAFWPVGAGPGSFAAIYPQFQPPGLGVSVEHAHNDYVQLLMEFGVLFVGLACLAIWLIQRQALVLYRQVRVAGYESDTARIQLCCALGLLALLLHSWVDFNLRIPANAMLAACLLGGFLRPSRADS